MNDRLFAGWSLITYGVLEIIYINFKQCSLLSFFYSIEHLCGHIAYSYMIPAVVFIVLGIYVVKKIPWHEKLGVDYSDANELAILKKQFNNFKVSMIEKSKGTFIILISANENKYKDVVKEKFVSKNISLKSEDGLILEFNIAEIASLPEEGKNIFLKLSELDSKS